MRFFGRNQKSDSATIHGIRLKVRAGTEQLPSPLIGAYVTAFSIASEPREAVIKSCRALAAMGYDFEEVLPEGLSLPVSEWGAYVMQAWPDFSADFPSQEQIADRLANDGVVFSPFAGWDTP